jgi:hypothetical protein
VLRDDRYSIDWTIEEEDDDSNKKKNYWLFKGIGLLPAAANATNKAIRKYELFIFHHYIGSYVHSSYVNSEIKPLPVIEPHPEIEPPFLGSL